MMSRERMTEDTARGARDLVDVTAAPDGARWAPKEAGAGSAAQNCEYVDMARIVARPPGRAIGWMAFCLEA